ncbi:hypothetical protein [uncultured Chitinophaga sp.]|uniref:hypothetical protein n=1 Tax=uncultured Chitinophaga sp. TaxID=339340 RepID=UPI0025FAFD43|nr:hypothetical protein [uncultured Chitinophaga sp.]
MSPKRLLRITIWVIVLGMIAETAFFLILQSSDRIIPKAMYVADFANKITWTYIVCVAISMAKSLTKDNVPATGLAGLLSIPPGLYFAGVVQKAVTEAMGMDASQTGIVLFIPLVIKTIEYGLLAIVLASMAKKVRPVGAFIRIGLLFGVLAAVAQSWYKIATDPDITFMAIIILVVNELIIPAGCAAIIYTSDVIVKKIEK